MLYINNAAVIGNLIYSGVLERFPALQVVSSRAVPAGSPSSSRRSTTSGREDHGRRGAPVHGALGVFPPAVPHCFWFERRGIPEGDRGPRLGAPHVRDRYPHPTCTYPDGLAFAAGRTAQLDDPRHAGHHGSQRGAALPHRPAGAGAGIGVGSGGSGGSGGGISMSAGIGIGGASA